MQVFVVSMLRYTYIAVLCTMAVPASCKGNLGDLGNLLGVFSQLAGGLGEECSYKCPKGDSSYVACNLLYGTTGLTVMYLRTDFAVKLVGCNSRETTKNTSATS